MDRHVSDLWILDLLYPSDSSCQSVRQLPKAIDGQEKLINLSTIKIIFDST